SERSTGCPATPTGSSRFPVRVVHVQGRCHSVFFQSHRDLNRSTLWQVEGEGARPAEPAAGFPDLTGNPSRVLKRKPGEKTFHARSNRRAPTQVAPAVGCAPGRGHTCKGTSGHAAPGSRTASRTRAVIGLKIHAPPGPHKPLTPPARPASTPRRAGPRRTGTESHGGRPFSTPADPPAPLPGSGRARPPAEARAHRRPSPRPAPPAAPCPSASRPWSAPAASAATARSPG